MDENITVYLKPSCSSCRKAIQFFSDNGIPIKQVSLKSDHITSSLLFSLLKLTENGVWDILKRNLKEEEVKMFEEMSTMEFITFITSSFENQLYLRAPLIIQGNAEKKVNIGFNDDEIRTFLPAQTKHEILKELYIKEAI